MVTYTLLFDLMIRVEEYVRKDGSVPYRAWFDALDVQAAAKVTTAIYRLTLGNISNVKWFEGMGEYVIDWGPGYRVYLARDGDRLLILFGGGTKRQQQADINRAKAMLAEYKARKKEKSQLPPIGPAMKKSGRQKR